MVLVAVATRHGDELNADFLRLYGVTDWRSLPPARAVSLCQAMLAQPESWTHRAMNPSWRWEDPTVSMQALQADYLALLVWMRSKDGQKGRNRPKPLPRPGPPAATGEATQSLPTGVDVADLAAALARPRT